MKVYLDDYREAPEGWIRTYTVTETIELLKSGTVTELSLDHDLGIESETGTGYDVLLWIEREVATTDFNPPLIHIHTANSAAAIKMRLAIRNIERIMERRRTS